MNVGIFKNSLYFTILVLALAACAGKPAASVSGCEQTDWYELGRSDGSQGSPLERLNEHEKQCSRKLGAEWEAMYANGRNAGLVEFCEAKNGYELGRSGGAYAYVCPSTVEPAFLTAYRRGQAARALEIQIQKLDAQISDLTEKLVETVDQFQQRQLSSQLAQLRNLRAKNDRELNRITIK